MDDLGILMDLGKSISWNLKKSLIILDDLGILINLGKSISWNLNKSRIILDLGKSISEDLNKSWIILDLGKSISWNLGKSWMIVDLGKSISWNLNESQIILVTYPPTPQQTGSHPCTRPRSGKTWLFSWFLLGNPFRAFGCHLKVCSRLQLDKISKCAWLYTLHFSYQPKCLQEGAQMAQTNNLNRTWLSNALWEPLVFTFSDLQTEQEVAISKAKFGPGPVNNISTCCWSVLNVRDQDCSKAWSESPW